MTPWALELFRIGALANKMRNESLTLLPSHCRSYIVIRPNRHMAVIAVKRLSDYCIRQCICLRNTGIGQLIMYLDKTMPIDKAGCQAWFFRGVQDIYSVDIRTDINEEKKVTHQAWIRSVHCIQFHFHYFMHHVLIA